MSVRKAVAAMLCIAISACSNDMTAPSSPLRAAQGRGNSQAPSLQSNSVRYRQQTYSHASNRSGSAALWSRALLGKDGNTVLEAVSSRAGETAAAGNISKLQIKTLNSNKDLLTTTNHNGLTGSSHTNTIAGLVRHSFIQTQANVRDIDPKRTDVVTVQERVNLRPDLAVTGLDAPEKVRPDQEFLIVAMVQEMNDDVGATNDCVLYVDGNQAKQIVGQWVAEGDGVNCVFKASIADVGTHQLEVRSQNVQPGDWDLANNAMSRSIEVVRPEIVVHGWADAYQVEEHRRYFYSSQGGYHNTSYWWHYQHEQKWDNYHQGAYMYGYAYDATGAGPFTSVNTKLSSDGHVLFDATTATQLAHCVYTTPTGDWYTWVYTCSYPGWTYVSAGTHGGRAVYYEAGLQGDWYYGYYWSYGQTWDNTWGTGPLDFGSEVTFSVRAEGANGTAVTADASLTFGPWQDESWWWWYNQPLTCSNYSDGYYYNTWCYEDTFTRKARYASGSF